MRRAFSLLFSVYSAGTLLAAQGTVSSLDGRKLRGEIEFSNGALVVKPAQGEASNIATTNIARAQFATITAAAEPKGSGNGLLGIYYNSTNFTGLVVTRLDAGVNFNWRDEAPALGVRRDLFSARWMGHLEAPVSAQYTIYFGSADAGRIYLDDQLLADHWRPHEYSETNVVVDMKAGEKRKLKLEYFDTFGSARAQLSWSTPTRTKTIIPHDRLYAASFDPGHAVDTLGTEGLLATYGNREDFATNSFTRVDPEIDFDWKGAAPAPGIQSNHFSVRWSGTLRITNSGEYRFYVTTGAPARLFIHNSKVNLAPQAGAPEQSAATTLRGGERCELRLEMRLTNNVMPVKLLWSGPGFAKTLITRQHLAPGIAAPGNEPIAGPVLPAGVVLLNGVTLNAPIRSANESSIRLQGLFSRQPLPLAKVSRIHVKPLTAELAAAVPEGRTGALLKNGDFIEGDFAGIENGRLKIGSVLFGNRTFDLARNVVVVVLRGKEPPPWHCSLVARDGTALFGKGISISPSGIALAEAPELLLPPSNLAEIVRRGSEMVQ